jgi:FKBP-type peptidyl-prolyl cis-trans isomerase
MTKENLLEMNRVLAELELKNIEKYIAETDTTFRKSPSLIRYKIENQGAGKKLTRGDEVHILFNVRLLDGSVCYTPDHKGDRTISLGRYDITRGLDEALLMLNDGGRGIFIIPADLAFGMVGDGDCIGSKKTLIYEILSIEKIN